MDESDISLKKSCSTSTHCRLSSTESARFPQTDGKDIWTLISEKRRVDAHSGGDRPDGHILVVGSPRGGKTTLIARYLNPEKDDVPKPTIGLEYTFARRSVSNAVGMDRREVVHIRELSGPRQLEEELMTAERLLLPISSLSTSVVVVVLDLSKPSEVVDTLIFWLEKIQQRIESFYGKLRKKGSKLPQQLIARERKLFGLDHEDLGDVKLYGVPLVVVGTKYDEFKDQDTELRKTMARTLRHMSHINGAALLYTTGLNTDGHGDKKCSLNAFRSIINHLVFHAPPYRSLETNHSKPLVISLGLDKLEDIGHPNGKDSWIAQYFKLFPSQETGPVQSRKPEIYLHAEKEIDELLDQKL